MANDERLSRYVKVDTESIQNAIKQPEQKKTSRIYDRDDIVHRKFDLLQIYFEKPYVINEWITINIPHLGEVIDVGETDFYSSLSPFVDNSTTHRVLLWTKLQLDWNKISDWKLFLLLRDSLDVKYTRLIFGDFDFTKLEEFVVNDTQEIYLGLEEDIGSPDPRRVLDEQTYIIISDYLRLVFNKNPKTEKAKGRTTKEAIIEEELDKQRREAKKRRDDAQESALLPLVSALLNHSGFKYKKSELKEINMFEFMDSVKRLQVYEQCTAFQKGMYGGFMDTSKISTEKLEESVNWMQNIHGR